jgi:hypothetical protein
MEKQMNLKRAFLIMFAALLMPGLAMAQIDLSFAVTKEFADNNPGSIEVTISCNTGLPLTQSASITEMDGVVFVVTDIPDIDIVECAITEDGEAGYDALYSANDVEMLSGCMYDGGGDLDNIDPELNTCEIINTPAEVPVVITKDWVITGAGGNDIDTVARVLVSSEGDIDGGELCGELEHNLGEVDYNCRLLTFYGDGEQVVMVTPAYDGTVVYVEELGSDSSVETMTHCMDSDSDDDDDGYGYYGMVTVYPTEGGACHITNTVFFEGIPTLNQYGLAILAVLMLGVGFVGFRRFV